MKALFVGIGSIGTRHLKNLHTIAREKNIPLEVTALRSSNRPLPQETAQLIDHQISKVSTDVIYDIAFITNPTNLHHEALVQLKGKVKFFFIEKPIFDNCNYSLDLLGLTEKNAYVAAPMRYCESYIKLKAALENLQCYAVRIICSSYLPDWRPNADYRTVYSAIRSMGGGVTIDLIHELDYMVDLFGFPIESHNFKGKYSHLEIDSDDLSVYISRYEDKICQVQLDYFGRSYKRICEVFTKDGTILADFGKGELTLADGSVISCIEDVNKRFIRELENVLCVMDGTVQNPNSPEKAYKVLALSLGKEG